MTALTTKEGELDAAVCRRARLARDPRFDGEFFVAVSSTGIFCRPVCPARLPAEHNVQYFQHAAQAGAAGYRPCLRCRPETAPQSPAWLGTTTTVNRALQLIRDGALDGAGSVEALAERLGVGARYLNKLFQRELGIAPSQVASTQRLLLARQLIAETALPLTDIAFAAGFGSVRRFNSAMRAAFGSAPGGLRRRQRAGKDAGAGRGCITLELRYRPPYDWAGVLAFFDRHAVAGVEQVDRDRQSYTRHFTTAGEPREFSLSPVHGRDVLRLQLNLPAGTPLLPVVNRIRRMADLDANPSAIAGVLAEDSLLKPLLRRSPGVRCPGYWSAGEAAVRAIVGQQISTAGARSICARLADACGGAGFPAPEHLLALGDEHFPMPRKRAATLRALGELCRSSKVEGNAQGEDTLTRESLAALAGVGPWTSAMVELRGWGNPDAFPATDLGLVQAWEALGQPRKSLAKHALRWRPFSGYAANLLWRTLS